MRLTLDEIPDSCTLIAVKKLVPKLSDKEIFLAFISNRCYKWGEGSYHHLIDDVFSDLGIRYYDFRSKSRAQVSFTRHYFKPKRNKFLKKNLRTFDEWFEKNCKSDGRKFLVTIYYTDSEQCHSVPIIGRRVFELPRRKNALYLGHYEILT